MKKQQVWRKVDGKAILCTDCQKNKMKAVTGDSWTPIGIRYECTAEDDICVRLKKPIEDKEAHADFKDFFRKKDGEGE